jgi:hypothetical protein
VSRGAAQDDEVRIDPRFCGPPGSGNGGYVAGRLAGFLGPVVRVRLHRPPPLETPLAVRADSGAVRLFDGERPIAEAWNADQELPAPRAPEFAEAVSAARAFRGFGEHPYPGCFVCGTERRPSDGLRIFAGPIPDQGLVAAPWIPDESLADEKGCVRREFVWAALDCPGAFTFDTPRGGSVLLGELTVQLLGDVLPGDRCVVSAWHLGRSGREGRKHEVASAIYGESGVCRGVARATWIEVSPAPRPAADGALPR